MSILRSFFIVFGFLVFAGVAVGQSAELPDQNDTVKTAVVKKAKKASEVVNVNSADAETLQKVKGIGKKKAEAIIDYRNANGNFTSLEDLLKVKARGINKKWLNKVKKSLVV